MKKENQHCVSEIIDLFFEKRFPIENEKEIQEWLIDEKHAEEKDYYLKKQWDDLLIGADKSVYRSLRIVNAKIGKSSSGKIITWRKAMLRIAAVILPLMIVTGTYLYWHKSVEKATDLKTEIPVMLEWIEIDVPNGKKEHIHLPDGTDIWINSGSTLCYIEGLTGDERMVKLCGEAYFEVAKDEKPFIIETEDLKIKVLGTQFNVNAYPEENQAIVDLKKGKLHVESPDDQLYELDGELQRLIYNHQEGEGVISVIEDGLNDDWKNGFIVFDDMTLGQIIRRLERHFDVLIEVEDTLLTSEIYSVRFTNKEDLHHILSVIEDMMQNISFKIDEDKIYLFRK